MADARPLLRIRGGIKAQSVWLCRGGRASGGGQGTHSGTRADSHRPYMVCAQYRATNPYAVAPQSAGPVRFTFTRHTRHVQYHVQAPVVLRLLPSTVHILFRARPAVQSAYDADSTFVIRPDALAGFATALLVPRYVAGVRGVEKRKGRSPAHSRGRTDPSPHLRMPRPGGRTHPSPLRRHWRHVREGGRIHSL